MSTHRIFSAKVICTAISVFCGDAGWERSVINRSGEAELHPAGNWILTPWEAFQMQILMFRLSFFAMHLPGI